MRFSGSVKVLVSYSSHRSYCHAHPLPISIDLQEVGDDLYRGIDYSMEVVVWFCRPSVWWDVPIIRYTLVPGRTAASPCIRERATVRLSVIKGGRGAARTAVGRYSSDGRLRARCRRATLLGVRQDEALLLHSLP